MPTLPRHNPLLWVRHANGEVTVINFRLMRKLRFPNMGHALNAAKSAKGYKTRYRVCED